MLGFLYELPQPVLVSGLVALALLSGFIRPLLRLAGWRNPSQRHRAVRDFSFTRAGRGRVIAFWRTRIRASGLSAAASCWIFPILTGVFNCFFVKWYGQPVYAGAAVFSVVAASRVQ